MLESLFESILAKAPWLVRWVFYIFWGGAVVMTGLFIKGWDARYAFDSHISAIADDVFERKIAPMKATRDGQVVSIQEDVAETKAAVNSLTPVIYRIEGKLDALKSVPR
jgi:hypothetical protein